MWVSSPQAQNADIVYGQNNTGRTELSTVHRCEVADSIEKARVGEPKWLSHSEILLV